MKRFNGIIERWKLILMLRKHISLSGKRHPAYDTNRKAKVFAAIGFSFMVLYLMFFAVMLSLAVNSDGGMRTLYSYEMPFLLLPVFFFPVDFFFRFMVQQTPSQFVKPYLLLPLPKMACVDTFLLSTITSWGNLVWFFFLVPFVIMTTLFSYGIVVALGLLFSFLIIILLFSQFYIIFRSLVIKNGWWWLAMPVVVALLLIPMVLTGEFQFDKGLYSYAHLGRYLCNWNPFAILLLLSLFFGILLLNRCLQQWLVSGELVNADENVSDGVVRDFSFLARWGVVGEFARLEAKSIMRNKNIRKSFMMATGLIVFFTLLISFTDIYDDDFMKNYLCMYDFSLFGVIVLSRLMCYEGNYIDCLMVHRENILQLLKAKYYVYSFLLIVPALIYIVPIYTGKFTVMMVLAYLLFSMGIVNGIFLFNGSFNKSTLPLNKNFMGNGGADTNYVQIIIQIFGLAIPILVYQLLIAFFGSNTAHIIMSVIGLIAIFTSNLWLKLIYKCMMSRKYAMLDGLRQSK